MEKSNQNIIQNIASVSTASLSPADNVFTMYFLLLQCVSVLLKKWTNVIHECKLLKSIHADLLGNQAVRK